MCIGLFYSLMNQIVTRQEVWKYRKVFDGYERDWLKMPFKKLDIGLISEKVQYVTINILNEEVGRKYRQETVGRTRG